MVWPPLFLSVDYLVEKEGPRCTWQTHILAFSPSYSRYPTPAPLEVWDEPGRAVEGSIAYPRGMKRAQR